MLEFQSTYRVDKNSSGKTAISIVMRYEWGYLSTRYFQFRIRFTYNTKSGIHINKKRGQKECSLNRKYDKKMIPSYIVHALGNNA